MESRFIGAPLSMSWTPPTCTWASLPPRAIRVTTPASLPSSTIPCIPDARRSRRLAETPTSPGSTASRSRAAVRSAAAGAATVRSGAAAMDVTDERPPKRTPAAANATRRYPNRQRVTASRTMSPLLFTSRRLHYAVTPFFVTPSSPCRSPSRRFRRTAVGISITRRSVDDRLVDPVPRQPVHAALCFAPVLNHPDEGEVQGGVDPEPRAVDAEPVVRPGRVRLTPPRPDPRRS